jgi:uncharacterized protein YdiU (UPF0061 family)
VILLIASKTKTTFGFNLQNTYAALPESLYTKVRPFPVRAPKLILFNEKLASLLGFNAKTLKETDGTFILSGNRVPEGSAPIAQAYAGHQFGHFTILGDGRAVLLGEQITPDGSRYDIQLKGSGTTPYSRGGDGRAAIGPMLREYIISEAMHALGIPTTRCLSVCLTGEPIFRETMLPGAILTRVAASHIRVGTFQYAAVKGTDEELKTLADYTLDRHYNNYKNTADNRYLYLLQQAIRRQASLIASWQLVGFIHGVMNTDNMALSGETIDYGPCAFMDTYDPATVFSSIDISGRYAYGNQPEMAKWNLYRFAETLLHLFDEKEDKAIQTAQDALSEFDKLYQCEYMSGMRAKLGLFNEEKEDGSLVGELLSLMYKYRADYTNTFLHLTFDTLADSPLHGKEDFASWHKKWQARQSAQSQDKPQCIELMKKNNPALIPRNHRVEEALAAAQKEHYSPLLKLIDVLSKPYAHTQKQAAYASPPPPSATPYVTYCGT